LKGGDNKVTIMIADPKNVQLFYKQDETFVWYDTPAIENAGVHTVCINNKDSHEKVAYLNFVGFPKNYQSGRNSPYVEKEKKLEDAKQLNQTHDKMMVKLFLVFFFVH